MEPGALSIQVQTDQRLPFGGKWFWTQEGAIRKFLSNNRQGYVVAWDKNSETGSKYYGYYNSAENFHECLIRSTLAERCAYELIVEDIPCCLYFDVEWIGLADSEHLKVRWVLEQLYDHITKLLKRTPTFSVACSTRQIGSDTNSKNSYHIVCSNIVFGNNHNGEMQSFIQDLVQTQPASWDEGGKCILDLAVYTKNRCFRTLGSTKKGKNSPLLLLNLESGQQQTDLDNWVDFESMCISCPQARASDIVSYSGNSTGNSATRKRPREDPNTLPFPLQLLEDLLAAHGDSSTKLKNAKAETESSTGEHFWRVQGHKSSGERVCLFSRNMTHSKNNCILFVHKLEDTRFVVKYLCMSQRCRQSPASSKIIGLIIQQNSAWRFNRVTDDSDSDSASHSGEGEDNEAPPFMDNDPLANTYEVVKQEFEKHTFKLCKPFLYIRLESDRKGEYSLLKHVELRQYYTHLFCCVPTENPEKPWKTKLFINEWLKDSDKKEYQRIVMDPQNSEKNCFNIWQGFKCDDQPSLPDDQIEDACAPIIRHIAEVITDNVQEHTNWILDWLANIVQRPWQKSNVAIVLFGKQGCGKGIIFDWFRHHVLGTEHTYQSANPDNDCFGKFALGLKGKVFVQVDEAKNLHQKNDILKNAITCDSINVEHKGKDTITISNLSNFIFTTNNEDCFYISPDDRRMCMFRCSALYKGNAQYFAQLNHHLQSPGINATFFQFLKSRDLSNYPHNFQASRPITAFYDEIRVLNIVLEKRFLSAIVHIRNDVLSFLASDLYSRFLQWSESEKNRYIRARNRFGMMILRVTGVSAERVDNTLYYKINCPVVRQALIDSKEFDPNVVIDSWFS